MLQFLVSTMHCAFDPHRSGLPIEKCVVVNQIDTHEFVKASDWAREIFGSRGVVVNANERGLSVSRNRAIEESIADICVISDDDVEFVSDASSQIEGLFLRYPDADVITYQVGGREGRPLRVYPLAAHKHTVFTAFNVISVEIAFRREAVLRSGIKFDTSFGLGSEFVSGEENIFIADLVRAGLNVIYVPKFIVTHVGGTSGGQLQNEAVARSKGAIIKRIFGVLSLPILLIFALRKSVQHRISFRNLIVCMWEGWSRL